MKALVSIVTANDRGLLRPVGRDTARYRVSLVQSM